MIGRVARWVASWSPFVWVVATPVLTVPLSVVLLFMFTENLDPGSLGLPESPHAAGLTTYTDEVVVVFYYLDFWPTVLALTGPGLLNLLAGLWFLSRNGFVRVAAGAAVVLGLVRTFLVLLVFFAFSQTDAIGHDGGRLVRITFEIAEVLDSEDVSPGVPRLRLLANLWLFYGAPAWLVNVAIWFFFHSLMRRFLPHLKPPLSQQHEEPRSWGDFFRRR